MKLQEEQNNHLDELEMVQQELAHSIEENKQVIAHFENEVSLGRQQIDALERYLGETKDTLDRQQMSHANQVEQMQIKLQQDRRELQEKLDLVQQELGRKERQCTTLENQKEALVQQLQQKEKQLVTLKEEAVKDKHDLQQRYSELKVKIDEKEDELTQKKIDYERQSALNIQQIQFTEQKANDLNQQLERTV